jgi:hypothetical protein
MLCQLVQIADAVIERLEAAIHRSGWITGDSEVTGLAGELNAN